MATLKNSASRLKFGGLGVYDTIFRYIFLPAIQPHRNDNDS